MKLEPALIDNLLSLKLRRIYNDLKAVIKGDVEYTATENGYLFSVRLHTIKIVRVEVTYYTFVMFSHEHIYDLILNEIKTNVYRTYFEEDEV